MNGSLTRAVIVILLAASFQFTALNSEAAPTTVEPFKVSANWGQGHHDRKRRENRTGDDRDRKNERDAGSRAREPNTNSDETSGSRIAENIKSGIACLNNPKCGQIWIPPSER